MINNNKPEMTADVREHEPLLQLHFDEHVLLLQLHVDEHELLLQLRVDDVPEDDDNSIMLFEWTVSELGLRLSGEKLQL